MRRSLSDIVRPVAFALVPFLDGCVGQPLPGGQAPAAQRANPASRHCVEQGATVVIERGPGGGQNGVCIFRDNRQCEEWALLRGECPPGGIRVAGYAARYCAITGGRYAVVARSGAVDEQGTCALPSGKTCDADAYYGGPCGR